MPKNTGRCPLTERHLAQHDQLMERKNCIVEPVSWAEKVVREERRHALYSKRHTEATKQPNGDDILADLELQIERAREIEWLSHSEKLLNAELKLLDQRQGICLEGPIERFLTPDGCSDPSYFARPGMKRMGIWFGNVDEIEKRKEAAKLNVELVNKQKAKVSVTET